MSELGEAKVLDVRGMFCPEPVFRTKIELERMTVGNTLKVIADDPASEEDISRWVNRTGHQLLEIKKSDKDIEFTIKKVK
ncbi:MAG TPA: sulfurtransferase TusA family protein [Nitrosopumilaceae archaeon]|nr:sulfurtransferase TusA family protein [Nitrosopumilaceae archaeon]